MRFASWSERRNPCSTSARKLTKLAVALLYLAFALGVRATQADSQQDESELDFLERFEKRLSHYLTRHKYFKHIDYERVDEGDFIFLIQRPPKSDADYVRNKTASYVALFEPLRAAFEERYVRPFGLSRPLHERYVIASLATTGDFENYARITSSGWHHRAHVFYDRNLCAAIIHESPISPRDRADELHSARHALVHAMQGAYARPGADLTSWPYEAMADHLACQGRMEWDRTRNQKEDIRRLLLDGAKEELRRSHLLDLGEFLQIRHPRGLASYLKKAADLDFTQSQHASAWWSYYRQAACLHSFLLEEADAKYATRYEGFLAGVFEGRESLQDFRDSFGSFDVAEIDRDYRNWMGALYRATWPEEELDHRSIEDEAVTPLALELEANAEAVPLLNLREIPADGHLGRALVSMRAGKTGEALEHLERADRKAVGANQKGRIERARSRVEAWIDARSSHFESLLETGTPIYLPVNGKKRKVKLQEVKDGEIVVTIPNRSDVRIDVEALKPKDLARRMKSTLPPELQWVRAYVGFLEREPRWAGLARGTVQLAALKEDEGPLEEVLLTGEVAEQLCALASLAEARKPNEGEANLEAIARLRREHGSRPMIQMNEGALDALARGQAEKVFDLSDPWSLLKCRVKSAGRDRVLLSWEFEDEDELEDLLPITYLTEQRKRLGGSKKGEGFYISAGALEGTGEDCRLLPVDLAAPLEVRYELSMGTQTQVGGDHDHVAIGICDDRQGRFTWLLGYFFLELYTQGELRTDYHEASFFGGVAYDMRLSHDGSHVRSFWEGKETGSVKADRDVGSIFLWLHSQAPIRIGRLEIEGRMTEDPFVRFRDFWVERKLEALR